MAQIIPLTPFHADVARALAIGGRRLLEAPEPQAVVPLLAPMTLYWTIKTLGLEEAAPLWLAASDEQRQRIVDVDCWADDAFVADELDAWLAPAMQEGPEALATTFLALDTELQVLFLQQSLRIIDHRALGGPEDDRGALEAAALEGIDGHAPHAQTPDGQFTVIDLTQEREVPPLVLIDALVREPHGVSHAYRLLTAARTELPSPLSEEAYQFRQARLSELGFCDAQTAAALFAPPAKRAPKKHAVKMAAGVGEAASASPMPAMLALCLRRSESLFAKALAQISDLSELRALQGEWMALVNAAIVGYRQRPSDVQAVGQVADWVRDGLSLGLEQLLATTPDQSVTAVLRARPLSDIFRHGQQAVRPLAERARRAVQTPAIAAWLQGDDDEADAPSSLAKAFVRSLAAPRPLWGGTDVHKPAMQRMWSCQKDVAHCEQTLDELLQRLS